MVLIIYKLWLKSNKTLILDENFSIHHISWYHYHNNSLFIMILADFHNYFMNNQASIFNAWTWTFINVFWSQALISLELQKLNKVTKIYYWITVIRNDFVSRNYVTSVPFIQKVQQKIIYGLTFLSFLVLIIADNWWRYNGIFINGLITGK